MSEITLVKFLFKKDWGPLDEVVASSPKDFKETYDASHDNDIIQIVSTYPAVLVIASVVSKEDLAIVLGFLKTQKKLLKEKNVKFSVVNYLNNKQVEGALMKLGCQEVMEPNIKGKALKFKMDFWKKTLASNANKVEESKMTLKDKAPQDNKADAKDDGTPKWVDAIKHADDMWINKTPHETKRILGRWMTKMMGPSPFVAQWAEIPNQKGMWKFTFKEAMKDTFQSTKGAWIYSGEKKPEFVWKENLWLFSGSKFSLFFQEGKETFARFRSNGPSLEIAKNSAQALGKERAIAETFDQEVLIKKGIIPDTGKTEIEIDKPKDGLLTQDMSGEEKIDGHLKGNVEGWEDVAEKEKKKKAAADRLDNLEGDSSTDNLGKGSNSGKIRKDQGDSGAENKKSDFAAKEKEVGGDAGTDDVGPSHYNGKMAHGGTERKSNYGGESSTDDLGDAHWSNPSESRAKAREQKAEAEKKIALEAQREAKERQEKGSFDKPGEKDRLARAAVEKFLEDGPDETANHEKKAFEEWEDEEAVSTQAKKTRSSVDRQAQGESAQESERERQKGDYKEGSKNPYGGKSSTDDLGSNHYTGQKDKKNATHNQIEEEEAAQHAASVSKKKKLAEAAEPYDVEAKTPNGEAKRHQGTDDLGANHYSSKQKRADGEGLDEEESDGIHASKERKAGSKTNTSFREESKSGYSGESSTDDLGPSHYKNKAAQGGSESSKEETAANYDSGAPKKRKKDKDYDEQHQRLMNDILPDGNAVDPQEEITPLDFDSLSAVEYQDEPVASVPAKLGSRLSGTANLELVPPLEENISALPNIPKSLAVSKAKDEDQAPATNEHAKVISSVFNQSNPKVEFMVHVDDFFDDTVIVRVAGSQLKVGEKLGIKMTFEFGDRQKRIEVAGDCVEIQDEFEGENYVTIQISKGQLEYFEKFTKLYQLRQQNVQSFLKEVKGL